MKRDGYTWSNDRVSATVSPETGALVSYTYDGTEMLARPLLISLYRPLTENDKKDKTSGKLWEKAGLSTVSQQVTSIEPTRNGFEVAVLLTNGQGKTIGTGSLSYVIDRKGVLTVNTVFTPDTMVVKSLPRVGLTFGMPAGNCRRVTYLGRGDMETYVDRLAGKIAIYETSPDEMFHCYVVPQATGNRTDTRWATLCDEAGNGWKVTADKPFQFSALPYTDTCIDAATHVNELQPDGTVTVHLDAAQTGVGTATCGPGVLPAYWLPLDTYRFGFIFVPVVK